MIYIASSWRNEAYESYVELLRAEGHVVHDWRDPQYAFHWRDLSTRWYAWSVDEYRAALETAEASRGFLGDMAGLDASDTCVLLLPCGKSAHLEFGYACGQGKRTAIKIDHSWVGSDAELMYRMADAIFGPDEYLELLEWLKQPLVV